jgi:hypothetical protein
MMAYFFMRSFNNNMNGNVEQEQAALAEWSGGIVSACHQGDWSYGS